jgi:hypothetical protein
MWTTFGRGLFSNSSESSTYPSIGNLSYSCRAMRGSRSQRPTISELPIREEVSETLHLPMDGESNHFGDTGRATRCRADQTYPQDRAILPANQKLAKPTAGGIA